jgi:hypothetical protein
MRSAALRPPLHRAAARDLLARFRSAAGRWNMSRTVRCPDWVGRGAKPSILIVGIYLADRQHEATHLVRRFASSTSCDVTQMWIALNGEPDSPELDRVTVERVSGRVPKFELVNRLLDRTAWREYDYILVSDDDITVFHGFIDAFIGYQRRFDFALAQPARTMWSRSSYSFVRQRLGAVARRTRFVEIGPIFSLRSDLAKKLLPFDETSPMGWGYDLVWPVTVEAAGMRMGIIDATPVDHSMRGQAAAYSGSAEVTVRDRYLNSREHLSLRAALTVIERYSSARMTDRMCRRSDGAGGCEDTHGRPTKLR